MSIASHETAAKPAERMNARAAMESLNAEAGKFNIWLRTQANAPAQRPWFRDTGIEASGTLAAGRVGANQIKAAPHLWRWLPIALLERIMGRLLLFKGFKPVSAAIGEQAAA